MSQSVIAVIGAGTMGQGIAQLALQANHPVYLVDQSGEQLCKAKTSLTKLFNRFVEKGKVSKAQSEHWLSQLTLTEDQQSIKEAKLVIEAIVERMDTKQLIFKNLEKIISPTTILATNTSSLSVTEIASSLTYPERFLGLHFFNPPGIMPLVEVVKAVQTEERYIQQASDLMKCWNKTPVRCKDTPGFIVNRVARPFYIESFRLLEENAIDKEALDMALREGMNFKMGPCQLTDFIGQDVNYAVSQSLWKTLSYPSHLKPSFIQGDLVAAKYLGRKSGRGFYRYEGNDITSDISPKQTIRFSEIGNGETHSLTQCDGYLGQLENGVFLYRTDGFRATDWENQLDIPIALVDISTNTNPKALAITYSPMAKKLMGEELPETVGLTGKWLVMPDRPGLINLRVISLIVNEAATVALQGIASEAGIDNALKGGVNYPKGAFEWLTDIGVETIFDCLTTLKEYYGLDGYSPSPYLYDLIEN